MRDTEMIALMLVERIESSLRRVTDCLARARDQLDEGTLESTGCSYVSRQLELARSYVVNAQADFHRLPEALRIAMVFDQAS
jgi:hypothetical protein